mmetsp:Transcript_79128/g.219935  ORF Transcript_79128/g.219935 Transcript_79128/m.219935 type:complete len:220 (+) Transcript_79128:595-1254(+)
MAVPFLGGRPISFNLGPTSRATVLHLLRRVGADRPRIGLRSERRIGLAFRFYVGLRHGLLLWLRGQLLFRFRLDHIPVHDGRRLDAMKACQFASLKGVAGQLGADHAALPPATARPKHHLLSGVWELVASIDVEGRPIRRVKSHVNGCLPATVAAHPEGWHPSQVSLLHRAALHVIRVRVRLATELDIDMDVHNHRRYKRMAASWAAGGIIELANALNP